MRVLNEFTVMMPKRSDVAALLKAGSYSNVNYLVKDGVQKKRIQTVHEPVGPRTLLIAEHEESISTDEVNIFCMTHRLERPTFGDAFLLGAQKGELCEEGRPIVFLHEPEYLWSGHPFFLFLEKKPKGNEINFVSTGGVWGKKFRFVLRKSS